MALSSYLVFKTARVAHVRAPGLALLRYVMMLVLMFYIGKAAKRQIGLKHRDRASSRAHCARCTYMERLASHPNTSELLRLPTFPPHYFASVLFQIIYKAGYQAHTDVTGADSIKVKGATKDQVRLGCTERAMRVCAW